MTTKNRGELAKLYALSTLLTRGTIMLTDADLCPNGRVLEIESISPLNTALETEHAPWVPGRRRARRIALEQELFDLISAPEGGAIDETAEVIQNLLYELGLQTFPKGGPCGDFRISTPEGVFDSIIHLRGAADSSLVNAIKSATAFRYEILRFGSPPTEDEYVTLTDSDPVLFRNIRRILAQGFHLRYRRTVLPILRDNLLRMTPNGDAIVAAIMMERFLHDPITASLLRQAEIICSDERARHYPAIRSLGTNFQSRLENLSTALESIIAAFSVGAKPGHPWHPSTSPRKFIHIIVTESGDLAAPDPNASRSELNYLLKRAYFDNPSTKRFEYVTVFHASGRCFIDLQLQIRVKSK